MKATAGTVLLDPQTQFHALSRNHSVICVTFVRDRFRNGLRLTRGDFPLFGEAERLDSGKSQRGKWRRAPKARSFAFAASNA
jgi:hypothetical protein